MPWTLLLRLVTGLFFWRLMGARRRQAAMRAGSRAAAAARPEWGRRVRDARDAASLVSRVVVTTGFGLATALCLAGGTSSTALGPRWLGITLLAIALVFGVLTVREALVARAMVRARRLRQRDQRVRTEV
jgi:Zn-dependent membrane protease YugP